MKSVRARNQRTPKAERRFARFVEIIQGFVLPQIIKICEQREKSMADQYKAPEPVASECYDPDPLRWLPESQFMDALADAYTRGVLWAGKNPDEGLRAVEKAAYDYADKWVSNGLFSRRNTGAQAVSDGLTWYVDPTPKPPNTLFVNYTPAGRVFLTRNPDSAMRMAGVKFMYGPSISIWMVPGTAEDYHTQEPKL
jgi:hypothetical protein